MKNSHTNRIFSHTVDTRGIIVSVSENWQSFAEENFGANTCLPEKIIGTPLLDHISDLETKNLYEIIIQKVRKFKQKATFSFRCDSPNERRFLKLSVIPLEAGFVEFKSEIVKTESRESVDLLKPDIERSAGFIRICSMCKKIAISETEWEEVEVAVEGLKLFEKTKLPQFTHGICQPCYHIAMKEIDRLK